MSNSEPSKTDPEQLRLQRRLVDLSLLRTRQSAERNYQTAERTLSVWIRTALGLMVFGIAIDRFGLILRRLPRTGVGPGTYSETLSKLAAIGLVGFGVLVAIITGLRFYGYARVYARDWPIPALHQPGLASFFAFAVALFGSFLFVIMLFYISF